MPRGGSSEDVTRVSEDLSMYRGRLEAGLEDNKRNREVIQGLSEQVQRFRQRNAENEASLAGSLPHLSTDLSALSPYQHYGQHSLSPSSVSLDVRRNRNKSHSRLDQPAGYGNPSYIPPEPALAYSPRHRSSPRLYHHSEENISKEEQNNIDQLFVRLKSELFKNNTLEEMNEMLREENDAALAVNEHLRSDVAELTKGLEGLEKQQREDQDRFRGENTRYRSQLEQQHRQLIGLWKAFTAVKKQIRELHTSTANDLDRQLTEFNRCAAMMQRAIRQAEMKSKLLQDQHAKEKDDVLEDIMSKYEKVSESNIEAEKKLGEKSRQLNKAESQLKKIREDNEELNSAISRICRMSELAPGTTARHRARSASPATVHSSSDAMRRIRSAISSKNSDLREANDKLEKADADVQRLRKQLESQDKEKQARRDSDKLLAEQLSERETKTVALENDLRRLNDRLKLYEDEKASREQVLLNLQNTLTNTHKDHKIFIEELMARQRDELNSRADLLESEADARLKEEIERADKAREEAEKAKNDMDALRQQLRELKADHMTLRKIADEKEFTVSTLEEDIQNLKKRLESEHNRVDEKDREITDISLKLEDLKAREIELKQELIETGTMVNIMKDENTNLQEQSTELKAEITRLQEKIDSSVAQEEDYKVQLENSQALMLEQESSSKSLKAAIQDLEIKLETTLDEARRTGDDLHHHKEHLAAKVAELSETVRQLEDTRREKELVQDDLANAQGDVNSLNQKIAGLEKEIDRKNEKEHELQNVLDDLRTNIDRLRQETEQKNVTMEDLKDELESTRGEMKKKEETAKADMVRLEDQLKAREREKEEECADRVAAAQAETKRAEGHLKDSENRLRDLTGLHENLMSAERELRAELEDLKESSNSTISKLKRDVESLTEQNLSDREEWDLERSEMDKAKNSTVAAVREELAKAEDEIKAILNREDLLKKDMEDLKTEIDDVRHKLQTAERQSEEKEEAAQTRLEAAAQESRSIASLLQEEQLKHTKTTSLLDEANRKKQALDNDLLKMEMNLTKKSQALQEFERKIDALMEKMALTENQEQEYKDQLAILNKENFELKASKEKITNRMSEEQKRIVDLEQQIRDLSKGMHNVKMRAQTEEEQRNERNEKVQVLANKVRQLELQLADKTAKSEISADLVKKMEFDGNSMMQEINREKDRVIELTRQNDELRGNVRLLSDEVQSIRGALEKKTASSKQAMNELVANYREMERNAVEMQTECEHLKGQMTTLNAKLDRTDRKKKELENKLDDCEARNAELNRKLNSFERSARSALQMTKSHAAPLRPGVSTVDIPRTSALPETFSLRTTTSVHDVSYRDERSVRFDDDAGSRGRGMDMSSSMEITLRFLKERIETLERDKAGLLNDLQSQKSDMKSNSDQLREAASMLQKMERKITDLQDENQQAESRLNSQRQLYLTNEESMRAKEQDHRSLKAKIMSAELHIREKDSKINTLTNQLESLRLDLAEVNADKLKAAATIKGTEEELRSIEDEKIAIEQEKNKLDKLVKELTIDMKNAVKRAEDSDAERDRLNKQLLDQKRIQQKDKETIDRLQAEEKHWRQAAVSAKKSSEDLHKTMFEERIQVLQQNHDVLLINNNSLHAEVEKLRQELRDAGHRLNSLTTKATDYERKFEDANHSKQSLTQQVMAFQKMEGEWTRLEKEMREELKQLRKDKLTLTSENEELKRRIARTEVERKEIDGFRARLEREVAALKKHVNALEEEKNRTEAAVRETMSERKAIDKSLVAMERENVELYRNCGQLQSQIAQLERDTGARSVTKLMKEQNELEGRIAKLLQEKRQLEMLLEQKDMSFSHKRKMLESQLSLLKDQLEAERKRRLDLQRDGSGSTSGSRRGADPRLNKSKPAATTLPQRGKSPFRDPARCCWCGSVVSCTYSYSSPSKSNRPALTADTFIANDTSTSIDTLIS